MKVLRVVFCILACACVLACVPTGIFGGWTWALVCALAACCFAAGMFFFKNKSEPREEKPDFMDDSQPNDRDREE